MCGSENSEAQNRLIAEANAIENVSEDDTVKLSKEGSHLQVFAGPYSFFQLRYIFLRTKENDHNTNSHEIMRE
jgi:hypothetical protein